MKGFVREFPVLFSGLVLLLAGAVLLYLADPEFTAPLGIVGSVALCLGEALILVEVYGSFILGKLRQGKHPPVSD